GLVQVVNRPALGEGAELKLLGAVRAFGSVNVGYEPLGSAQEAVQLAPNLRGRFLQARHPGGRCVVPGLAREPGEEVQLGALKRVPARDLFLPRGDLQELLDALQGLVPMELAPLSELLIELRFQNDV